MATVNSTSGVSNVFSNTYGITNKGIGGLLSGLDTDSLVEALTAGTRAKIAKQSQQKTLLKWKQTAYRDVATTIKAFQSARFDYVSAGQNNIRSTNFFNTYKGTSTSSKVSLVGSSTTATGTVKISEIRQLAESEKYTVDGLFNQNLTGVSFDPSAKLTGSTDERFTGQTLQIQVDSGVVKTIKLDSLNGITDQGDFQQELQRLVDNAVGRRSAGDGETADADGKVSIVKVNVMDQGSGFAVNLSSSSNKLTVTADSTALGFTANQSNRTNTNSSLKDLFGLSGTAEFKLNGQTIELNMATDTVSTLISKINSSNAGVKAAMNTATGQLTFTSESTGAGSLINFEDGKGGFLDQLFGTHGGDRISSVETGIQNTDTLSSLGITGDFSFVISVGDRTEIITSLDDDGNSLGDITVQELINKVNTEFGSNVMSLDASGNLVLDGGAETLKFADASGGALAKLFGTANYNSIPVTRTEGKNAEIVVDGQVIHSETNNFSVNGMSFTVSDTHAKADGLITLSSQANADELVDKLKTFVEEYNGLVETLYTLTHETPDSDYPPLTDEQKADMTDEQIKKWETEAKKGLLYNDSAINSILNDLRASMVKKVDAAGLSLADIGIAPASYLESQDMSKMGKLVINEEKLRSAINNNPDSVSKLFTDPTDGIGNRMNQVLSKAVETSSDPQKRGSLVKMAGTDAKTGDNTSEIGDKIDTIDKYISTLKLRLETEYKRHWSKFSALETSLQRLNTQSSWLSSFGS